MRQQFAAEAFKPIPQPKELVPEELKQNLPLTLKKEINMKKKRVSWEKVLLVAKEIVESSELSMTLRQLFYQLVSRGLIPNTQSYYGHLSKKTAAARREGIFPDFIDATREIHEYLSFQSPVQAKEWLSLRYRRNRTEGQGFSLYLGVEKRGLVVQLKHWFSDYGVPILCLGGYSSQTYVNTVVLHVEQQERPSVLIYAGDFDPSGEDIHRDFVARTNCFDHVERVALNEDQISKYDLVPQMGKTTDPRAFAFVEKYGELSQTELDALTPKQLKSVYMEAFKNYFDFEMYEKVLEKEAEERESLCA